jgi:hypothetical protein
MMGATPRFRMTLSLLDYSPSKRERYVLRVIIETVEEFSALPYQLVVERRSSGSLVDFTIRGLAINWQPSTIPSSAAYIEDIGIEHEGSVTIAVWRADNVCSIPIALEHGKLRIIEHPKQPTFLEVRLADSDH